MEKLSRFYTQAAVFSDVVVSSDDAECSCGHDRRFVIVGEIAGADQSVERTLDM
jgi:hypothetical protein